MVQHLYKCIYINKNNTFSYFFVINMMLFYQKKSLSDGTIKIKHERSYDI